MKLDSVSVTGLRSLADVSDIPIMAPTVLTGANDSGKSTVLLALEVLLANKGVPGEARTRGTSVEGADVVVEGQFTLHADEQRDLSRNANIRVRRVVPMQGPARLEVLRAVPEDARLHGIESMLLGDLKELAAEYGVRPDGGTTKPHWQETLTALVATLPHTDAWVAAGREIERSFPVLLSFDGSDPASPQAAVQKALAAKYRAHLDDPEIAERVTGLETELTHRLTRDAVDLCKHVEECHDDLGSVEVHPTVSLAAKGLQSIELVTRAGETPVTLAGTGAGRARRVALAVWEWSSEAMAGGEEMGRDVVVAYDEPDTHLDYCHQRTIMETITRQCADPRIRMVVTTHSMNLIDGVDLDKIVNLVLVDEMTTPMRLAAGSGHGERNTFLRNMAAAVGLRNSILVHERLFVGVEGATEQEAFPALFRLQTGRTLQSAGIALWACGNDIGALRFAQFLAEHGRNVAFVVDEDCRTKPGRHFSEESLRKAGIDPAVHAHYLGAPSEFEDLFSDEQWASVANVAWPRRDGREWTSADIAWCRIGKFSKQWQQELNHATDRGPIAKPTIARAMAFSLRTADEIPEQFRTTFDALVALANA